MLSPVWACEGEQLTEPEGEAESRWCGPPLWLGRPGTFTTARPLPRKRLEEAPLVTKAFREAQMKEKLQRYPKVPRGRGWGWCGLRTALRWGLLWFSQPTGHWPWSPVLQPRPAGLRFVNEPVSPVLR